MTSWLFHSVEYYNRNIIHQVWEMKRPSMVNFVRLHSLWIESRDLRLSKGPTALQLRHRPNSLSICPHLPLYTSATSDSHSQFRELVSQRATCFTFSSPLGVCRNVTLTGSLIPKPFHITCLWCPPLIALHLCFLFFFYSSHFPSSNML